MALGFASPSILFLNTWDAPERSFCKSVFKALPGRGYTRYVEPCCGAFAMPLVSHAAGWKPDVMEASDSSLFSSIVGYMLARKDWAELGIRVDGDLVDIPDGSHVDQAAYLLYLQLLVRTQARPSDVQYWADLVADLIERRDDQVATIRKSLVSYDERLGGLDYRAQDMWSHMAEVMDDPNTVVSINPPTYKGGFERFFDTKGRLTWNEPAYEVFDPHVDIPRLVDSFEGKKALLLCQQQREPGDSAHPQPVFARHLSLGQYVYLNSNRPDEVFDITGGPKVAIRKSGAPLEPYDVPMMPLDYEVRPDSVVDVVPVQATVADYYRNLWMHRLNAQPGPMNGLMLIDGMAAGVMGFNAASMLFTFPAARRWREHIILRFAFGAPHNSLRLTRLATMVALCRGTVNRWLTPLNSMALESSKGLVTIEYTRHPEAKGLRGLMKLADRTPHPDGYRLIYGADWAERSLPETVKDFLAKEKSWQRARAKQQ